MIYLFIINTEILHLYILDVVNEPSHIIKKYFKKNFWNYMNLFTCVRVYVFA